MSKPWIIFIFILWTATLVLLAPFLFSITKTETAVFKPPSPLGLPPLVLTYTTKRPILDWTRRLQTSYSEASIDGQIVYSSKPGAAFTFSGDKLIKDYKLTIAPDGSPSFTKP